MYLVHTFTPNKETLWLSCIPSPAGGDDLRRTLPRPAVSPGVHLQKNPSSPRSTPWTTLPPPAPAVLSSVGPGGLCPEDMAWPWSLPVWGRPGPWSRPAAWVQPAGARRHAPYKRRPSPPGWSRSPGLSTPPRQAVPSRRLCRSDACGMVSLKRRGPPER